MKKFSTVQRIPFHPVVLAMSVVACASSQSLTSSSSAPGTADASGETGTGGAGSISPETGGMPPIVFADGSTTPHRGRDAASICAAEAVRAEGTKLDLLVLMDGSGSMGDDVGGSRKWDLVVNALRAFVNDPESAGIGVGLTYFGIPAGQDDAGDLVVSCNVADYAKPVVPLADLPANAPALTSSLAAYKPIGGTPTLPALEGALQFATRWLAAHPTHRMIIVLATDGEPNDCDSTVDAVSTIAALGASKTASIPTYVIGVGTSLTSLNQVAVAAGTGAAYLVDTNQDTTARFIAAMRAIRGRAALPCEYAIPKAVDGGGMVDTGRVNVSFTDSADAGSADAGNGLLPQVADKTSCDATRGGWYYDDPALPKNIELCDASCTRAKTDFGGSINILVGCETVKLR